MTDKTPLEAEREAFEKWAKLRGIRSFRSANDIYVWDDVELQWQAWQARAQASATSVQPVEEPMTSNFNWFPALSAIVEIWKAPRDYRPGALDECIDSARIRLDEWRRKVAPSQDAHPTARREAMTTPNPERKAFEKWNAYWQGEKP